MKIEISDGWTALIGQSFLLTFFIPFNSFLLYSVSKNISVDGLLFASVVVAASFLLIRIGFCYAEITLTDNFIIIKKLFKVKKVPVTKFKTIGKGIPTSSYYLEFENEKTVYFFLKFSDSIREYFTLNPDKVLEELKIKFKQAKANYDRSVASTAQ